MANVRLPKRTLEPLASLQSWRQLTSPTLDGPNPNRDGPNLRPRQKKDRPNPNRARPNPNQV
jgi:hypothetical protein